MADNVGITAGAGTSIATDDIGGVQYQRVKNVFGVDGVATDVSTTNPMPVGGGLLSTANSSTANLAAAAAFTGTGEDVSQYASVSVFVYSSHASATDGLSLQFSTDNTNWDSTDVYTVPAATGKTFGIQVQARYFRVVYTNGGTLTTRLAIQTIHHSVMPVSSSVRPQDARSNDNDMAEMLAYQMLYNGTTWDRQRGDTANGLDVDVTRLPTLVAGTAIIGKVGIDQTTNGTTNGVNVVSRAAGGATTYTLISAATTNAQSVKASAGTIYSIQASNTGAAAAFLKIYNKASAPTVGTDVAVKTLLLPAGGGNSPVLASDIGVALGTGIAIAITALATTADTTAVALSQVVVNIDYA